MTNTTDKRLPIFFGRITRVDWVDEFLQYITTDLHLFGKVKVYKLVGTSASRLITFNAYIDPEDRKEAFIRISSRKETGTIFTMGGLAHLTKQSGWRGNKFAFKPDWEKYRDTFIYDQQDQLIIRPIELEREIDTDTPWQDIIKISEKDPENMC
jgi:hypothetical protein